MCKKNNDSELEDELNRMQIDQLHNATLNFSNNSLETKKLCVTAEIASVTLWLGLYQSSSIDNLLLIISISSFLIALLFYVVDIFLYYYQDKLRESMIHEENKIRQRHSLPLRTFRDKPNTSNCLNPIYERIRHSILNASQIMYLLIALPCIITFCISFFSIHSKG